MKLHDRIALGLVAGAILGVGANRLAPDSSLVTAAVDWVAAPVGQVFLRLLLMTVVPLVFASLALAAGGFRDIARLGRVGGRTLLLFLGSTAAAAAIGLTLVALVQPGGGLSEAARSELMDSYRGQAEGLTPGGAAGFGIQTFVNIVPRNPVAAAAGGDMLAVIFFALALGVALRLIPEAKAAPMLALLESLNEAVLKLIEMTMRLAPFGVFGLIFAATARFGWELLQELLVYVLVVVAGLALHAGVTLSVALRLLARTSPLAFWRTIAPVALTAFSTSSSNATLPTSIRTAEEELGVPREIAGFVLPLGATMNMNGTALYEGVTVLFLAQVFGVELGLGQQMIVVALSVITAVGAAGVPGGSLPLLMLVLATVGVPPESIAIILGIDRILDMSRTTVNVCGDLAVTMMVARGEGIRTPAG